MQHIYIQIGGDIYIYTCVCVQRPEGPSLVPRRLVLVRYTLPLSPELIHSTSSLNAMRLSPDGVKHTYIYIYMYICMYVCKTISTHYFVWLFFSVVLLLFNPWEKLHMGPLDNSTTAWHKRKLNVMVATETIPPTVGIVFICHQHHQTMCYYQYCMQTAGSW